MKHPNTHLLRRPVTVIPLFLILAYTEGLTADLPAVAPPLLVYSTYLGGSQDDQATAIATDPDGNVYVTGYTRSLDFPGINPLGNEMGVSDVFVAKFSPAGRFVWSTYFGGSNADDARDLAVDAQGNAYVTGHTWSDNFPITEGAVNSRDQDGSHTFVAKLSSSGELAYSARIGGGSYDVARGIAVDGDGNVYITGQTASDDFPNTEGAVQSSYHGDDWGDTVGDAFVTKLNPNATAVLYSTLLGGHGVDSGARITVDSGGNIYVAGTTGSADFPTTSGAFQPQPGGNLDAFVAKIDPETGALVYSTYLGGTEQDMLNLHYSGGGLDLDGEGQVFVSGSTWSHDFPTTPGALQTEFRWSGHAFVTKLAADGASLIYSTFFGSDAGTEGYGVKVDATGCAYLTGFTRSNSSEPFPIVNPLPGQAEVGGGSDAFLAKLNPEGSGLIYSTFIGGSGGSYPPDLDIGIKVALDPSGNAYVTGSTPSPDFPLRFPFQSTFRGGGDEELGIDAFVLRVSEPLLISIDIKPNQFPNTIRLGSGAPVTVAILSNSGFDATTIDPASVTLVNATVRLTGKGTPIIQVRDVNGDGRRDLVVQVGMSALQLTADDTEARLQALTLDGRTAIVGADSVRVVP